MSGKFSDETYSVSAMVAGSMSHLILRAALVPARQTGQCVEKNGPCTNGTQTKKAAPVAPLKRSPLHHD